MHALEQPSNRLASRSYGFTLVELVVVILIVAILATATLPRFRDASAQAEASVIVSNVKAIFNAAEHYAADHGEYPADSNVGDYPPELVPYLEGQALLQRTALGGFYDWNGRTTGGPHIGVAIRLTHHGVSNAESIYNLIEENVDDSDPNKGWVTRNTNTVFFKLDDK